MEKLAISVIIATKNVERTIEECLISVQRNNPAEIIIVDGNSTDRTLEIAKSYTDRIYSDGGRGFNYAQRFGAEQAGQQYIAYIDADIVLAQGTLAILLAELKASNYVSMQAKILAASCSNYWERAVDQHCRWLQARKGGGLSAAVLRKDTILKHEFDPFARGGSDTDFKLTMEREGYKLGSSSVFVHHHHRADLKSLFKQMCIVTWDSPRFIRKYGPWHAGFWPPLVTLYWIAYSVIKGKPWLIPYLVIVHGIAGTAGMVKGFIDLLKELRR